MKKGMKIQFFDTPEGLEKVQKAQVDNEIAEEILKEVEFYLFYLVKRFATKNFEDYMQEANFAMLRAIRTFDFHKGTKFTSYSLRCVRNALIRYSTVMDKNFAMDYRKKVNLSLVDIDLDKIESKIDGDIWLEEILEKEEIENALSILDEKEQFILKSVYGICGEPKRTYTEIGDLLHLKKEWIGQIVSEARGKMRRNIKT